MSYPIFGQELQVMEVAAPLPKVSGGVLYAPLGTTLPTDATTPIGAPYVTLGRVSNDGVDRTEERGQVEVFDWGTNLVASLQDKYALTIKFKLLQIANADVTRAVRGKSNVGVTAATLSSGNLITSALNPTLLDTGVWIIDAYYMAQSMRLVMPNCRVVQVGPVQWASKQLTMYDLTLRPFPDTNGNHAYEYWNDGQVL